MIRLIVGAAALGVATWWVDGIRLTSDKFLTQVATLLAVALVFGVLNTFLKPIVKLFGCAFYVVTLGLFAFVVNGCLLWLTSWIAGQWDLPFHVDGFWPAVWGAIIIGVVSWLLNLFVKDEAE
ncbi:MAG: phage holin family protein [Streptosporangiaceae bacterium]